MVSTTCPIPPPPSSSVFLFPHASSFFFLFNFVLLLPSSSFILPSSGTDPTPLLPPDATGGQWVIADYHRQSQTSSFIPRAVLAKGGVAGNQLKDIHWLEETRVQQPQFLNDPRAVCECARNAPVAPYYGGDYGGGGGVNGGNTTATMCVCRRDQGQVTRRSTTSGGSSSSMGKGLVCRYCGAGTRALVSGDTTACTECGETNKEPFRTL